MWLTRSSHHHRPQREWCPALHFNVIMKEFLGAKCEKSQGRTWERGKKGTQIKIRGRVMMGYFVRKGFGLGSYNLGD